VSTHPLLASLERAPPCAHPLLAAIGTLGDPSTAAQASTAAQDAAAAAGVPTTSSGAIQAISSETGLPTNLTQAEAQAFGALPPSVQATIKGAQTDAATAAPAITLASTIAAGGVPSEAEIIGGLAAVATIATGNPLVGAAIGAIASIGAVIGDVLTDFFNALGLYDHVASYDYVGFVRVCPPGSPAGCVSDPVPYGPADPYWIDVSTYAKFREFYAHGDANHPALSGRFDNMMVQLLSTAFLEAMTPAEANAATGENPYAGYLDENAWDRYFGTLMIANLQYWANAQAYVPPRALLQGAVVAWNAIHASSPAVTYAAPPPGTPASSATLALTSMVLGPVGDSVAAAANNGTVTDVPPVTVNLGPLLPNVIAAAEKAAAEEIGAANAPPAAAATASSTGTVIAAAAGVAAVGVGVWAGLTGRLGWLGRFFR
jgi:hypothetical protein